MAASTVVATSGRCCGARNTVPAGEGLPACASCTRAWMQPERRHMRSTGIGACCRLYVASTAAASTCHALCEIFALQPKPDHIAAGYLAGLLSQVTKHHLGERPRECGEDSCSTVASWPACRSAAELSRWGCLPGHWNLNSCGEPEVLSPCSFSLFVRPWSWPPRACRLPDRLRASPSIWYSC